MKTGTISGTMISTENQFLMILNEDPGLSRLFWGVVVFRRHVILGIEMLSKYECAQSWVNG